MDVAWHVAAPPRRHMGGSPCAMGYSRAHIVQPPAALPPIQLLLYSPVTIQLFTPFVPAPHALCTTSPQDTMESFFLSETVKYLYLLFSNASAVVDHFVLSTEVRIRCASAARFFGSPQCIGGRRWPILCCMQRCAL